CLAGDASCFPGIDELAAFNASIGGRLSAPPPYGNVCYNGTFDLAACQELVNNKRKAAFRENITAAMMYVNNEFDENGLGCPVPNTVPSSPLLGTCALGALGAYFVNAQSAEDVSLAMKFAAKYNLRLRIKNTGHDHTGRSTDPGAFIIRTSGMKSLEFEPDFVPYGCKSTCGGPQPVLALGAGVITKDLYSASEKLGVVTIGGFTPTVGMAGGFLVGGGALGPWQPLFGMGVDNVVQYDVVLVDGTITTVNKCHNADLFWAMRGGGGVYAIVIKAYLKAHPAFQAVNVV
ncbi:FAD-binding domain-containing protein, partial [Thozetella sp. PMI_491]